MRFSTDQDIPWEPTLRKLLALVRFVLIWGTALVASACLDLVPANDISAAASTEELEGPPVESSQLSLVVDLQEPGRSAGQPVGPLRVFIQQKESSLSIDLQLTDIVSDWPTQFVIPSVPDGPLRVTVYEDENGNRSFDDCPFPHRPQHTELIDERDRLSASQDRPVRVVDRPLTMNLKNTICGPGRLETGIDGTIEFPEDVAADAAMVYLYLEPEDQTQTATEVIAPLRIPLFEGSTPGQTRGFSIGEILPGRYSITAFTDNDGDHSPSPCTDELGGGDQYVVQLDDVEVLAGQRRQINTPLILREMGCDVTPTGLTGQLFIAPELVSDATELWRGQWSLLAGAVYINLVSTEADGDEKSWRVLPSVLSRPLPQTFTVTGVTPGLYRVEVFLDRDGDGRFVPCDGTPSGFDSVYTLRDDVRVTAEQVVDMGELELISARCNDESITGLLGEVITTVEEGSSGSGRAVRRELDPLDTASDRLSFTMFNNHWKLPEGGAPFTQEVPRGAYRGRVYLDTNKDGDFTECGVDPHGDRSASAPFVVDITPGTLVNIGAQIVEPLECMAVFNELVLMIDPVGRSSQVDEDNLRLRLREAGGWQDERMLNVTESNGIWLSDPVELAPGRYEVLVYLDDDGDGTYRPCDAAGDSGFQAEFMLDLDRGETSRTVGVELAESCP